MDMFFYYRRAIGAKLKLPLGGGRAKEEAHNPELEAKHRLAAEQRQAILANRWALFEQEMTLFRARFAVWVCWCSSLVSFVGTVLEHKPE